MDFVAQLCMLKDALRILKHLSLYFPGNNASLINARTKVEQAKAQLLAMKQLPGKSLKKFLASTEATQSFRGVVLIKTDAECHQFESVKRQFYQSLVDNLVERFPCTEILKAAKVLEPAEWPSDELERTLFGSGEVTKLCKLLTIPSEIAIDVLSDFSTYKASMKIGHFLRTLIRKVSIYPISSADCERGFSVMNRQHTGDRNRLHPDTVSSLLTVAINGPPVELWDSKRYVLKWLRSGRHGSDDKLTGKARKKPVELTRHRLFTRKSSSGVL